MTRQPRWGSMQYNYFSKNLPENIVKVSEERNDFVLEYKHGRRNVKCKPEIADTCNQTVFSNHAISVRQKSRANTLIDSLNKVRAWMVSMNAIPI